MVLEDFVAAEEKKKKSGSTENTNTPQVQMRAAHRLADHSSLIEKADADRGFTSVFASPARSSPDNSAKPHLPSKHSFLLSAVPFLLIRQCVSSARSSILRSLLLYYALRPLLFLRHNEKSFLEASLLHPTACFEAQCMYMPNLCLSSLLGSFRIWKPRVNAGIFMAESCFTDFNRINIHM